MDLRHRPMRADDIPACIDLVKADPVLAPRYGPAITLLPAVWSRLLGQESFRAFVFEVSGSGRKKIIAVAIVAFVSADFVRQMKTAPFVWIAPEVTRRVAAGHSPLLSDREVGEANLTGTLDFLIWTCCIHPQYVVEPEVHNFSVSSFIELHSGYYLREGIMQAESEGHLQQALGSGGLIFSAHEGRHVIPSAEEAQGIVHRPHLIGITRDAAERQIGTWITAIFRYQPPRLGLSRGQQRLLTTAMNGGTDAELAAELGISVAAVKKSWRDIYDRVHDRTPELFPAEGRQAQSRSERGKAKKHRLLSYMREHPEELRPIARKKHHRVL